MPDQAKDLEFLLAIVKTGALTIDQEAAAAFLGLTKKQVIQKMCIFRKNYDYPLVKDGAKDGDSSTPKRGRPAKRPAPEDDGELESKKPAAKRGRKPKNQQNIVIHEDAEDGVPAGTSAGEKVSEDLGDEYDENDAEYA